MRKTVVVIFKWYSLIGLMHDSQPRKLLSSNKVQDIIVFRTWKVFDSNYFLNIVSKGDMREVVNRESQMNTIFQKKNHGFFFGLKC